VGSGDGDEVNVGVGDGVPVSVGVGWGVVVFVGVGVTGVSETTGDGEGSDEDDELLHPTTPNEYKN